MKHILVTGGAGFIGSNFVRSLLEGELDVLVVNLDVLTYAGSMENLKDLPDPRRHVFVRGDICDRDVVDDVMARYEIDTVVHFAAESHVDRSIVRPDTFIRTNIVGTFTLLESVRKYWLSSESIWSHDVRFHHISTDEVYGSLKPDEASWTEVSPYEPNSPYAASKAASDHLVRSYGRTYGLPYTITNCSNNYGPYQFPEKLIPLMILNAIEGKPLPIYGDGKNIRDWLYVEDHCEAIQQVLEHGRVGETYNIGGSCEKSNIEVVKIICGILDQLYPDSPHKPHASLITYIKDRPGHDRRYAIDSTKIKNEFGLEPKETFDSGLIKTIKWYGENSKWLKLIQTGAYREWIKKNYDKR